MKNIEDIYMPEDIREEIRKQNDEFDLFDFYLHGKNDFNILSYGMGVITSKQSFYCYANKSHEALMENILLSLYDDFDVMYKKNNYDWRSTITSYGDICIQLMSNHYSLVWLPSTINKYQLSKLFEFYDSMKRINDYFISKGKNEIKVGCACNDKNGNLYEFDLDYIISEMAKRVSDENCLRDEAIIVDKTVDGNKRLIRRRNQKFN